MKSKIVSGSGFGGVCNYIYDHGDPVMIDGNMTADAPRELASEFRQIAAQRGEISKPVIHIALSLPPGDHATPEQWREIVRDYLIKMGLDPSQHQYIAIQHHDRPHDHIHIICNAISLDGENWCDKWSVRRSIRACGEIEQAHTYLRQTAQTMNLNESPTDTDADATRKWIARELLSIKKEISIQMKIHETGPIMSQSDFMALIQARGIMPVPMLSKDGEKLLGYSFAARCPRPDVTAVYCCKGGRCCAGLKNLYKYTQPATPAEISIMKQMRAAHLSYKRIIDMIANPDLHDMDAIEAEIRANKDAWKHVTRQQIDGMSQGALCATIEACKQGIYARNPSHIMRWTSHDGIQGISGLVMVAAMANPLLLLLLAAVPVVLIGKSVSDSGARANARKNLKYAQQRLYDSIYIRGERPTPELFIKATTTQKKEPKPDQNQNKEPCGPKTQGDNMLKLECGKKSDNEIDALQELIEDMGGTVIMVQQGDNGATLTIAGDTTDRIKAYFDDQKAPEAPEQAPEAQKAPEPAPEQGKRDIFAVLDDKEKGKDKGKNNWIGHYIGQSRLQASIQPPIQKSKSERGWTERSR